MMTKWQTLEEFEQSPTEGWCWVTYLDSYTGKTEVELYMIQLQLLTFNLYINQRHINDTAMENHSRV